jgi:hypothetical protein
VRLSFTHPTKQTSAPGRREKRVPGPIRFSPRPATNPRRCERGNQAGFAGYSSVAARPGTGAVGADGVAPNRRKSRRRPATVRLPPECAELLTTLTDAADDAIAASKVWPKRPDTLSKRLIQHAPLLRTHGLEVVRGREGGGKRKRFLRITQTRDAGTREDA